MAERETDPEGRAADPVTEAPRPTGYRWRPFKAACHCIWFVATGLLLLLLYLTWVGFPAALTKRVESACAQLGYDIRIERLRLHPLDGVVAHRVTLFISSDDLLPTVEANELVLGFDPREWLLRRHGLSRLHVRDGVIRVGLNGALHDEGDDVIRLDRIMGDLRVDEHGLRIAQLEAHGLGMEWRCRGRILRDLEAPPITPPPSIQAWRSMIEQNGKWLRTVKMEFDQLRQVEPALVHADFLINRKHPEQNHVTIRGGGGTGRFRGLLFEQWEGTFTWEDVTASASVQAIATQGRKVRGKGWVRTDNQEAFVELDSDLLPVYWRNLMPATVRAHMERARINALGTTAAALTIGPSSLEHFGRHLEGWIEAEQVEAHGVWLESFRSELIRDNDWIRLENIEARIGRDRASGPATGQAAFSLSEGIYHGQVTASFDAREVLPVAGYSSNAAHVIQSLVFDTALPEVDVTFSGSIQSPATFHFEGDVRGTDFTFTGSRIKTFDSVIQLTNRVLRFDPLFAEREEGQVDGWFVIDFNRKIADLDIRSGVDPRTLARIGGGTIERILRPLRFDGPVQVEVKGRVDYKNHIDTDYRASGTAERVGWRWLNAERVSMDWIAEADRITMTNVNLAMYGGQVDGNLVISGIGPETEHYSVIGRVSDVSFPKLLRDARQTEEDLQEGVVSGRFAVAGLAEDDWRASLTGDGRVRIRDGQVFQIRLFGGLSQLLGMIYPRLGSVTQNDVRADFEIADRRIRSDDIRIEGSILSLRGYGHYHLDDRLDFKVQVQPLRRGLLADAFRVVTYPVTRLLQFHLTGSLSEPAWGIDNLPRELWSLFDRAPAEEQKGP